MTVGATPRQGLLARLAQRTDSRIVLLVLDGLGGLRTESGPRTALDAARTPNLDGLAVRSALGRLIPVGAGITPGSGPAHLALFGHDPTSPEADIGRGVLEALGLGLDLSTGTVAARGNFATVDSEGLLTDRRAGRIASAEAQRVCSRLRRRIAASGGALAGDLEVEVHPGEGYRFVLLFRALPGTAPLDAALDDTDPQAIGKEPLPVRAAPGAGEVARQTAARIAPVVATLQTELRDEAHANSFLLRGFSTPPKLPSLEELYRMRAAALAGYPLYRGVARACGMEVVECGPAVDDMLAQLRRCWDDFEFFFLHVKATDMAGEDGNFPARVEVIEAVDEWLPRLLDVGPDVLAITGDHSTPSSMKAHSWHPVPLLLWSDRCFVDECVRFTEVEALRGALGTIPSSDLMGVLLANAGKLRKYGA